MPSLSELQKFKASFQDLGRQKADLTAKKLPFNDLELPGSEPEPLPPPKPAKAAPEESASSAPPEAAETPIDDLDFGAFLGAQPDDLPEPPAPIITDHEEEPEGVSDGLDAPQGFGADMADDDEGFDLGIFDDLNLSSEAAAAEEGPDMGGLDDLDIPDEAASAEEGFDMGGLDDLGIPDEAASAEEGFDMGGLDDLDIPDEAAAADEDVDMSGFDDLGIPDEAAAADEGFDMGGLDDLDIPDEAAAADEDVDMSGFDELGDLGSEIDESGDLNIDDLGDFGLPDDEAAAAGEGGDLDIDGLGDFGLPDDEAAAAGEGGDLDIDDLGDFGLPDDEAAAASESGDLDIDDLGDFGASGDEADIDDLGGFGAPDDEAAAAGEDGALDIDDLGGFGIPSDEADAAIEGGDIDDLGGFDDAGEGGDFDAGEMGDSGAFGEGIDLGDFDDLGIDGSASSDEGMEIGLPGGGNDAVVGDLDDDSFAALDNILQKTQKKKEVRVAPPPPAAKGAKKGKAEKEDKRKTKKVDEVDEISLSDEELEALQETLSRYPLNLRVACEEIIAEHVVSPQMLSELIEHLVWGATAKETASLASRILGRTLIIPKNFEKSTGAALEAERQSFAYIFVHNFLPVLRLFVFIAIIAASLFYLIYKFAYIPHLAETLYQMGYERIFDGEYERANERFSEAFAIHRKKDWFYRYAEAFRDERQYIYAEQKYEELLSYYLRDKKGILDYAYLETHYLRNYAKADSILRNMLLDYHPNDFEGLLAAGDNSLVWGEVEPSKYEDARYYYARLMDIYGWREPVVERMLRYFVRTDNLKEVLYLKHWFDNNLKWDLSAETLSELGGYLLDKQLEEVKGVPNEYVDHIDGVRDILLKAVYADPALPEPHYHLARYYKELGNTHEERVTLRVAARAFEDAREESIRRLGYHIDTLQRYGDVLVRQREFMAGEEQYVKGINLYEDAVSRRLIARSPQYGKLYAALGDLAYFTKVDDMEAALRYYHRSEENGWSPPEMQYRMGAAYYRLENWRSALEYLFAASSKLPLNQRLLYALGNAALKRGDYFAAQGYYNRLLDLLENQRVRLPMLLPNDRPEYLELAERLMHARNNAGVASEMLAAQTGNRSYYTHALALYAESSRAWDALNRDPRSMIRSASKSQPFLNSHYALHPQPGYEPQIFIRIDREAMENSLWEEIAPIAPGEKEDE